ncbi:MAG: HAMP domain-containing sensor histidine kinase [Spirosomataceae bacterium]
MKFALIGLLLIGPVGLVHAQFKTPVGFCDYLLLSSRLDSLQKPTNPTLYLLIATELAKQNWDEPMDIEKTKQILPLAKKQKSQVGLAMTYFILGRYYSFEKEDSLSYDYLTKAEKIFTENKDTTGMLYCYRFLRLSMHENYIDLAKQYFNKLIALSTKSGNPVDKYFYYLSILSADPYFEKQPTENQLSDAFNKAIEMIDRYSYCEFMRRNIYHNLQQGYSYLNKYDKVLDIALQTIRHPKIKANYMDYQNLGRVYIRLKKFDEAIVALEKAGKEIKTADPTNYRRQRNIYKLLKTAYYNVGNWKAGVKADEEYDRLNEIIVESDRSLAMFHLKEKYSFTEKEAELKRIALENQVVESRNKLLNAQYEAKKRETALISLAFKNQITESKTKLLRTQMEVTKKESAIELADSQKRLMVGGLLMMLALIGVTLFFTIRLRRTNAQLRTLQAGRDKLYTIIAHDLRSTVNNFADAGGLLHYLTQNKKKEDIQKVIQQIEYMGQHAQLQLNNLFEWGKSQYFTHEREEPFEQVDVVPLLEELSRPYLALTNAKNIGFQAKLPARAWLTVSPKGLTATVRNLLDNALKHTPAGGTITLELSEPTTDGKTKSFSELVITDTGTGIAPDQLHYLQQVFSGKIKPEAGVHGVGLGMVIIFHFVKRNEIKLLINSQVGEGTVVKLQLTNGAAFRFV